MPWLQTREILKFSKNFYRQMRRFYEGLNDENDIQLMGPFLDAYRRYVEYLEREIRALEIEASREILDAWFRYSPDPQSLGTDPTARIAPGMTLADVLRITIDFDVALAEFYLRVAQSIDTERVRMIFLGLAKDIEIEKEKLVADASGLMG